MNVSKLLLSALFLAAASGCGDDPPAKVEAPASPIDAGPPAAPPPKALARLEAPQGAVTLERQGKTRPAQAEPLYALDAVETGGDGAAVLRFGGDRLVELGGDGRFELGSDGAGVLLSVARGLVLTRVAARPQPAMGEGEVVVTISTPFGLTRVGASVELSVKVGEDTADVEVKVGEIELVQKSGEVTKVAAGKKGTLGAPRELPEIALTVVSSSGKAELKAKDSKRFVAVNPRKPPALGVGDIVRVREGRFSIAPTGSATRLSLLKGAEVGLLESRKGEDREETSLDVKKGELEVSAPRGQKTRVSVAGGVTIVSDLGGQYSLRRTGSGFDVEALAGDVTVERAGQDHTVVPGGQAASVPLQGPPTVRPSSRDAVSLPSRMGLRVFHSGLREVSLTWDEGEGDPRPHRVQVATEPVFKSYVRDGVVHGDFLTVPVPAKGALYWRVLDGEQEIARGSASFAPEPRSVDLSRLKNVVPEGSETTTIFFQDRDKPPVVNFTWGAAEGAAKYVVKVYREGQLSSPVAERTVPDAQVALPENTLDEGKYLWSVTPLDAKGAELKGGRMNKLHMVFDNAVAALLIKAPRNGEATGKAVATNGIAPVGSRLFINGKTVSLDDQARFETTVSPLAGGRLVYRLLQGGGETYTVRTVRAR